MVSCVSVGAFWCCSAVFVRGVCGAVGFGAGCGQGRARRGRARRQAGRDDA